MTDSRKTPDPQILLAWYDANRRHMPWRAAPGARMDPYHVWLSEIMLQQTTVATVGPYFQSFLARWPSIADLAAAELDDVLHAWQGLGYYARARNLYRCAGKVAREMGGLFPDNEAGLRDLPGIGAYTAAAIAAIAFGQRAVVVDGNVERVMARVFAVREPLPGVKTKLYELADRLTPESRAGDYAQAVMDLGATVCTPRKPKCLLCPWKQDCAGRDEAESLPRRAPKPHRPTRRGIAFWITRPDGAVLLRRRPEKGLLGGMIEVPSTNWIEGAMPAVAKARKKSPLPALDWREPPGMVTHTFTHFHLELRVIAGRVGRGAAPGGLWVQPDKFGEQALPTIMKKIARHALKYA
ncbi:MAG: A/G-specific adenine glycosylase [Alphaproteobacteria bacterium]|nr:A/G-specific adenine glycosylase [Alphaproteobacteria bacterium]